MILNQYKYDVKLTYDELALITSLRVLRTDRHLLNRILFEINTMSYSDTYKWVEVILNNFKEDVEKYIGDILNVDFVERKGVGNG